ncbi:MAG: RNA 2',3'-cyclic phosphodiesterase [Bacteroidales bacterium]|nr:RNA 2',3'-cyclic phosphodiesterase [Bacteroidales bacterium]
MRTFIALPVTLAGSHLEEAALLCRRRLSAEKIAWVDLNNVHITLFFLGETDPAIADTLSHGLETIASGHRPFSLQVKGLGYFGSRSSPRVLWAGISENKPALQLQKEVKALVTAHGFVPDERDFHPHITLARLKYLNHPEKLHDLVAEYRNTFFQEMPVDQMVWMESQLTPAGAVYRPLRAFPLQGK